MLDKLFNKKKKDQDIFTIPERKNPLDIKTIPKLGPKALQQIVLDSEKYISTLISKFQEVKSEYHKMHDKTQELKEKNDVINAQVSKMSNQHQELTIKFDNLQSSLEIMITTSQQQLNSQLNFIKSSPQAISINDSIPKTIDQVFSLYQDRFQLCSKISQQNKFLKEKITDIQLKFDEIKERYEEAEKQKGFNSLIPELMVSLEELKKERRNLLEEKKVSQLEENVNLSKQKNEMKEVETMTSFKEIESPKTEDKQSSAKSLPPTECQECKKWNLEISELKKAKQSLIQEVSEWSSKCQSLSMSLQEQKQEINGLKGVKQENEKGTKQLKETKENVQKLTKQNKKQKDQIQELRTLRNELEGTLNKAKEENKRISVQLQAKEMQLTTKESELGVLTMKVNQLTQEKTQKLRSQQLQQQTQQTEQQIKEQNLRALYEEQIKSLTDQNTSNLQEITLLKQQIISKTSEINRVTESLQKTQQQLAKTQQNLAKTKESLTHSQQMTNSIEEKYKKMMAENQESLMDKIKSLEVLKSQNQKELIFLRNFKMTTEQDIKKLQSQKKILQDQCKQLETYKNDIETRILPNLRTELQTAKKQFHRISQEKQMIQQNSLDNINQLNNNYQFLLTQKQVWAKEKSDLELTITQLSKDASSKKQQIETYSQMIEKLNLETTDKLLQIQKLSDQQKSKSKECEELYEQLRSKQRKYESELNQERIKLETMKRTITVQETKLQENQKSSNKFYEESMHKDKKISYMEVKLKEYKHLIQSLKKQKEELQKTYQEKLKNYEESIAEVHSEEQDTERKKKDEERKSQGKLRESDKGGAVISGDKDVEYFRNQLMSFEQSNLVLTEENSNLRQQIKELEEQLTDRKKMLQNLQQKREQTLKQIQKLNLRSINGSFQQPSLQFIEKQKQFVKQREQFEAYKQKTDQRMKKIALKAYKGFDILLKRHHSLYKEFMAVFVKEIADREEVKNIESEINMLVNKSTDMKDVFQDYI